MTEIQLRHRCTEAAPSLAFHIGSVWDETEPYSVAPPEVVSGELGPGDACVW